VFDHFKGGSGIPDEGKGGEDEEIWKRFRKWLSAVENRKSVKETLSERQHYLPIYQRYAEDRAQSEAAKVSNVLARVARETYTDLIHVYLGHQSWSRDSIGLLYAMDVPYAE
jgi:hypothetical protein